MAQGELKSDVRGPVRTENVTEGRVRVRGSAREGPPDGKVCPLGEGGRTGSLPEWRGSRAACLQGKVTDSLPGRQHGAGQA